MKMCGHIFSSPSPSSSRSFFRALPFETLAARCSRRLRFVPHFQDKEREREINAKYCISATSETTYSFVLIDLFCPTESALHPNTKLITRLADYLPTQPDKELLINRHRDPSEEPPRTPPKCRRK